MYAGDLAGMELRQRRGQPPLLNPNHPTNQSKATVWRDVSLSPTKYYHANSAQNASKQSPTMGGKKLLKLQSLQPLRRRDADYFLEPEHSDNDSDSDINESDPFTKSLEEAKKRKLLKKQQRQDAANKNIDGTDALQTQLTSVELEDVDVPSLPRKRLSWHRNRSLWIAAIVSTWILAFVAAGVILVIYHPDVGSDTFQAWRLCFFFAGLPVIWYIGSFVSWCTVRAVEKSLFTVKNALYFAYAVRRPICHLIRALLTLGWWPLMMLVNYTGTQSNSAEKAYNIVLKVLGCVTLFFAAAFLKTLLGKFMALKFNKESHLTKMMLALKKEQWLRALLTPRPCVMVGDGDGDDNDGNLNGSNSTGTRLNSLQSSRKSSFFGRLGRSASAAVGEDGTTSMKKSTSGMSSGRMSSRFRFWRRDSEPLPSIREEGKGTLKQSSENEMVGMPKTTTATTARDTDESESDVAITIDKEVGVEEKHYLPTPIRTTTTTTPMTTSPYKKLQQQQQHAMTSSPPPLSTPLVASPVPPPQHRAPTQEQAATKQGQGASLRSEHSLMSTKSTLSTAPSFGLNGPLKRDEVMTRLAKLERYIRKTELEVTFKDALNNTEKSAVTCEEEAKRVGLFLFWNLKSDFSQEFITLADVEDFLPHEDALAAYEMLDYNSDGLVGVDDCVSAVDTIFQERRNLAASLKDTRSIAASLETTLGVIFYIIVALLSLYILFHVTFDQVWALLSATLLALSFIFGQYIRVIFENLMFLFANHPFDIGDMLFFDDDYLQCDEISINYSVFINSSKQRLWIPYVFCCFIVLFYCVCCFVFPIFHH